MLHFALCLSAADPILESNERTRWQYTCMLRAVSLSQQDVIRLRNERLRDVCRWNGVQCTSGLVTTFVAGSSAYHHWEIFMMWLPQTIQHLQLVAADISVPLESDTLPRDLRYLFMQRCDPMCTALNESAFDSRRLPQHLEEFHLVSSWITGTIVLDELPRTMRILQLMSSDLQEIICGDSITPEHLERIIIQSGTFWNVSIVSGDSSPIRGLLTWKAALSFEASAYYGKLQASPKLDKSQWI